MNKFSLKVFFQNLAQLKEITPYQKDVLVVIVSFIGKDGCYPSYPTIAAQAGVCVRTVAKVIKEARLRGWLDWTNVRNGRRQSSNRYHFTVSWEIFKKIKEDLKEQIKNFALFQRVQRMHGTHRSPYYYINKERFKLFSTIKKPENHQSTFQKLFQENPELALKQLMAS